MSPRNIYIPPQWRQKHWTPLGARRTRRAERIRTIASAATVVFFSAAGLVVFAWGVLHGR